MLIDEILPWSVFLFIFVRSVSDHIIRKCNPETTVLRSGLRLDTEEYETEYSEKTEKMNLRFSSEWVDMQMCEM